MINNFDGMPFKHRLWFIPLFVLLMIVWTLYSLTLGLAWGLTVAGLRWIKKRLFGSIPLESIYCPHDDSWDNCPDCRH
jgi:bacteriorhodopsin